MSVDQNASYIMETVLTVCDNPIVYSLPQKNEDEDNNRKKAGECGEKRRGNSGWTYKSTLGTLDTQKLRERSRVMLQSRLTI